MIFDLQYFIISQVNSTYLQRYVTASPIWNKSTNTLVTTRKTLLMPLVDPESPQRPSCDASACLLGVVCIPPFHVKSILKQMQLWHAGFSFYIFESLCDLFFQFIKQSRRNAAVNLPTLGNTDGITINTYRGAICIHNLTTFAKYIAQLFDIILWESTVSYVIQSFTHKVSVTSSYMWNIFVFQMCTQ